ncbi:cytosolic endo-beta-N-acetylglucosaminidase-like isoform X2 [Acanthaster planci]|uniref:Cytosolic endo-beta-N-acetylglucosaminidase n=1 Tax=Acanthaster planci TaxID=133434 RepID=A0A8B7Y7Z0_ACAPL|nr:cytosolic endo-beta-N-acetylglucosaminidase-like isoform X2 [Acanthaster planci]
MASDDLQAIVKEFQTKVKVEEKPLELEGKYEPVTSEPICQPLKTMEDVLSWKPEGDEFNIPIAKLAARVEPREARPRTLVCHDMMGGYIDDRFVQGVPKTDCYRFYHWQYLDMFMYFSHYFVTVPPPGWTNAAHKNGVPMLGTVITEWTDGFQRCEQAFASEASYKALADKLVAIAKYYKFDGWLINIENKILPQHMPQLVEFMRYLPTKMHEQVPGSKVIWYDSVITDGSLRWQDMLNDLNRVFFDACDGIFLNYTWNAAKLASSVTAAGDRQYDVFVGVDVFGRNCFGGGGFNTNKAMSVIRQNNLSAAIFAPGWVFEKHGAEDFNANQTKFWSLLDEFLPSHGVASLPFFTNFCQGFGEMGFRNGQAVMNKAWCNLSAQQVQPTYDNHQFDHTQASNGGQRMTHSTEDGYSGGGSLLLSGNLNRKTVHTFRVFYTSLTVSHPLLVSYSVKPSQGVDSCIYLRLSSNKEKILLWTTGDSTKESQLPVSAFGLHESELLDPRLPQLSGITDQCRAFGPLVGRSHKAMQDAALRMDSQGTTSGGWNTRHYLLPENTFPADTKVTELGVMCLHKAADGSKISYSLRLGELKICDPAMLRDQMTQVTDLECLDLSWHPPLPIFSKGDAFWSLCATLRWRYAPAALHFDVYCQGVQRDPNQSRDVKETDVVFIGRAHARTFRICHLLVSKVVGSRPKSLDLIVQPTTAAGFVAPLVSATRIKVTYSD